MNLGLSLSIFRRELLARPRMRRFYWRRVTLIIVGGLYVLFALLAASGGRRTTMGLQIFMPLAFLTLIAMSIVSPTTAAGIVTREKEERTFGLLFLSDITGWRFVLGKLLTSLFYTAMTIFSVLPLFMLVVSLGGVSSLQIAMAFLVLMGTMFFCSCVGILAGCVTRTERGMNRLLGSLWGLYYFGLPAAVTIPYLVHNATPPTYLGVLVSPFWAMGTLIQGMSVAPVLLNVAANVALGIPLLWLAQALVPRMVAEKDSVPAGVKVKGILSSFRRLRPWVTPPPILGNPVTWKDLQYFYGGMRATWLKCILFNAGIISIVLMIAYFMRRSISLSEAATSLIASVFFCSALLALLGSMNSFGMMFTRERKSKALEMLLTTDLTDREIILGKVGAALLSVMPWAVTAAVTGVILLFEFGINRAFWQGLAAVLVEGAAMWFAFSSLSIWLSIRYKKNIAMGVCILVWMLWNSIGRLPLVFLAMALGPWVLFVMDIMIHVAFGCFFLWRTFATFRKLALQDVG